jgi:oxygen-independent coproporphyrinogen-3 oxidase
MIEAIKKEIRLQSDYLNNETVETVYFGGGTPSLLETDDISAIFEALHQHHDISPTAEITLEANPDDLTISKINAFKSTPINRFSIGIQSFHEVDLKYMNRAHNATEAIQSIKNSQDAGFENITVDLIYGTPTMNNAQWEANIQQTFDLNIPHISCYALTVEPNTALDHFIKKGKSIAVNEEQSAQQFEILVREIEKAGYAHYEISNFAKEGFFAQHNSNYWKGQLYLGLGPSAHSFNKKTRQWNVANNMKYIQGLNENELTFEIETLSPTDQYNEYVMTGLRTIWGVELEKIKLFGNFYEENFIRLVTPFIKEELVVRKGNQFILSKKAKFLADGIAADLFI